MSYKFKDVSITSMSFGYVSLTVNPDTGEISGFEDHPYLIDKWLNSGTIVEIETEDKEEEVLFEESEDEEED